MIGAIDPNSIMIFTWLSKTFIVSLNVVWSYYIFDCGMQRTFLYRSLMIFYCSELKITEKPVKNKNLLHISFRPSCFQICSRSRKKLSCSRHCSMFQYRSYTGKARKTQSARRKLFIHSREGEGEDQKNLTSTAVWKQPFASSPLTMTKLSPIVPLSERRRLVFFHNLLCYYEGILSVYTCSL